MTELKQAIMAQIMAAESIAITTHINPDGDGFCAALALQRILQCLNRNSTIWMDNDDLSRYAFLDDGQPTDVRSFATAQSVQNYDLAFVLDCNSYDRIGARRQLLDNAKNTVMLDHHVVEHNPIEADISLIETHYVSVGAILFALFKTEIISQKGKHKIYTGNCLYTTILNDTNNYANANTDAAVFALASELTELGIKPYQLYKEFFLNHSAEEMRYVGQTLATIELHHNRKVLFMHSTLQMSIENNIDPESVMNITRWVQGVAGLDAIVYFREEEPGRYKLSLRSTKLDVNRIAVNYGGGGHIKASGCTIASSLPEIKARLLQELSAAIDNL